MRKNILFINGRLPIPLNIGGDGDSIHSVLKAFMKLGFTVESHNVVNKYFEPNTFEKAITQLDEKEIKFEINNECLTATYSNGYPVTIHKDIDLNSFLDQYLKNEPDTFIFTQLDLSREVLDYSLPRNIPTVVFVRDIQRNNFLTLEKIINSKTKNVHMVFNSNFTRDNFKEIEKYINTSVMFPPIDTKKFNIKAENPKYITVINPVKDKGGNLLVELAKKMPEYRFLAVKGWYDPVKDNIDLDSLKNIKVWERQDDITKAYKNTKLLLVPSQIEEGFGRVAAEGLVCKIPVIASYNAGLKDALGDIGYYVNDFKSVEAWTKKIKEVLALDEKELQKHLEAGKNYAMKFDSEHQAKHLAKHIKRLV